MKPPKPYQDMVVKREDSARWWSNCPFHDDKNPSFSVNKGGRYAGNYRCWSCGAKGSPRTFARRMGQWPSTPFPKMDSEKGQAAAPSISSEELARLCVKYRHYPDKRVFQRLADKLGIIVTVLDRFYVGFDGTAYCFIMLGAYGEIVGIRLRTLDGRKYAVKGGRNGLFVPTQHMNPLYPIIVTEGESDCMAACEMGFQVVGIPGSGQCKEMLADWMEFQGFREAVLFSDNDSAGRAGAKALADYLTVERRIKVKIYCPPRQYKDFREYFNARAKRSDVLRWIEKAPYHIGARLSRRSRKTTLTIRGGYRA